MPLSIQILIAIVLGLILGSISPNTALFLSPIGDIFIRLLKMIIVPLVLASITMGVVSLGDIRKLGSLGIKTLVAFIITTLAACAIGLGLAQVIKPGLSSAISLDGASNMNASTSSITQILTEIVPENIFEALVASKMLSIILFAILLGVVLTMVGSKAKPLVNIFDALNEAMMKMTDLVMLLAPVGVMVLMSVTIAKTGLEALKPLAMYMICVLAGLLIHALATLPSICIALAQYSPLKLFKNMFPALVTSFSTSSSAVAMPITMDCLIKEAKASPQVTSFVIPLGTTINMDGTALYQSVAAVFIAQVYGIELSLSQMIIIAVTATFASIGAAAIPSAGLITMVMILNAVGLPVEGISLILGVDRLLDMCRSAVNLWGNSILVIALEKWK